MKLIIPEREASMKFVHVINKLKQAYLHQRGVLLLINHFQLDIRMEPEP